MNARAAALSAFADAIADGHVKDFPSLVKLAREAGANLDELLVAVRVGRGLAEVPESVLSQAYHAVTSDHGFASGLAPAA